MARKMTVVCVHCGDELNRVAGGVWHHLTGETHCEAPYPTEVPFWLGLLQDHIAEAGHEEGFDADLGPYCQTCADMEV